MMRSGVRSSSRKVLVCLFALKLGLLVWAQAWTFYCLKHLCLDVLLSKNVQHLSAGGQSAVTTSLLNGGPGIEKALASVESSTTAAK